MKKCIFLLALVSFFFVSDYAEAQINRRRVLKNNRRMSTFRGKKNTFNKDKRYNYVGLSINALNYFGDLAPLESQFSTDISFTRPGYGITFGHRFGPRYTFRGSFTYGTLRGDDFESASTTDETARFRYLRNLQFRNRIKELTLTAMFDLLKNESSYISRVQFTPYIFTGVTVFHHNPQALVPEEDRNGTPLSNAGDWVNLRELGTEGQYTDLDPEDANFGIEPYSKWQIAIPIGFGVRYRLNQVIDLSLETGIRWTFTDYLDDVSQNYVEVTELTAENSENDAVARALSDRSWEPRAAAADQVRDTELIAALAVPRTDGVPGYKGFGEEFISNNRGNKNDNDVYFVTTIRVSFIIGATFRRAKFR